MSGIKTNKETTSSETSTTATTVTEDLTDPIESATNPSKDKSTKKPNPPKKKKHGWKLARRLKQELLLARRKGNALKLNKNGAETPSTPVANYQKMKQYQRAKGNPSKSSLLVKDRRRRNRLGKSLCREKPCHNRAQCRVNYEVNSPPYECLCRIGYSGRHCSC